MLNLTPDIVQNAIVKRGYVWYGDRPNLVGIRSANPNPNHFSDTFALIWKQPPFLLGDMPSLQKQVLLNTWLYTGENGLPLKLDGLKGRNTAFAEGDYLRTVGTYRIRTYTITTLPGKDALLKPINPKGTAVMKPGQYIDAYSLGLHKGKPTHPALIQTGPISVYRDINKDAIAEATGTIDTGLFGCNIHRSNSVGRTPLIGAWSAGCQVFQTKADHDQLLTLVHSFQSTQDITRFTYTLLDEKDL